MNEPKVWIRRRNRKGAKPTYHIRWIERGHWRSEKIGTDRKLAERAAAIRQQRLADKTYQTPERIPWTQFLEHDAATLPGRAHAT